MAMDKRVEVFLLVLANIFSVVGVVGVNKMVYKAGFTFPTTLMVFHFLCTWGFVVIAARLGWFTEKKIPTSNYAYLGGAQMASVGFVNMSLMYNTVGTYQLFKFTNVFVTAVMEYFWKGKVYSAPIYATLTILVVSVSVATVTAVEFSSVGVFFGIIGSVATAAYQILNKAVQTDNDVAPLQLLQYEQPFTALFAAMFALFTDDIQRLIMFRPSGYIVGMILVSCVFAFGTNLTVYLIIGKTGPLTYAVVGHLKTIGVLLVGFFVFNEITTTKSLIALIVAFGAIVWYSHLSMNSGPKPAANEKPATSVDDDATADTDAQAEQKPLARV